MSEANPIVETVEKPKIFLPENVALTILLTSHLIADDLGDINQFRNRLRKVDIFIPEDNGYTPELSDYFRKVSKGYLKPLNVDEYAANGAILPSYTAGLMEAVHRSQTNILLVDTEHDNPIFLDQVEWMVIDNSMLYSLEFEQTIDYLSKHYASHTDINRRREEYILETIGPALIKFIERHPKLKNKPKVEVLMLFGALHENLFHKLSQAAIEQKAAKNLSLPTVKLEYKDSVFSINDDPTNVIMRHFYYPNDSRFKLTPEELKFQFIKLLGFIMISDIFEGDAKIKFFILKNLTEDDIKSLHDFCRILNKFNRLSETEYSKILSEFSVMIKISNLAEEAIELNLDNH